MLVNTIIPTGCACIAVLLGFGLWQGLLFKTNQHNLEKDDGAYTAGGEELIFCGDYWVVDSKTESSKESASSADSSYSQSGEEGNKIVVNSIDNIPADRMNICLSCDDFVEMTREEMIAYYGTDYIPDVPSDIKPWEEERSGIYRRNGGTGEIYWDVDILNFSNEDFTRNVNLEVAKGHIPWLDYMHFDHDDEKSIINNTEVLMGKTESGYYYAEFMYLNVGFAFCADGLTQEEFVKIVSSVID